MTVTDAFGPIAAGVDRYVSMALVPMWSVALLVLLPAIWRLSTGRGRYTDAIWGIAFAGISNRLSYLLHVSPIVSHVTAAATGVAVIGFAVWYQLDEAREA